MAINSREPKRTKEYYRAANADGGARMIEHRLDACVELFAFPSVLVSEVIDQWLARKELTVSTGFDLINARASDSAIRKLLCDLEGLSQEMVLAHWWQRQSIKDKITEIFGELRLSSDRITEIYSALESAVAEIYGLEQFLFAQ